MVYDENDAKGFNVYQKYSALKNHFTLDSYDYFKYNGKVNIKFDSYQKRRDKYMFNKMSSYTDYENIILANLVDDPKKWIGDISDKEGMKVYREWVKIQDSITRIFISDLQHLDQDNFKDNFRVVNGQQPKVVKLALRSQIHLETFAILLDLTKTSSYIKEKVNDPVLTPKLITKAVNYHPFLKYDEKKMIGALDNVF